MTLQDYASLAEIISSIAVIATLIFVGLQIRQSNHLLQRGKESVTMEEWSRIRLAIVENHDVARIWQARLDDSAELDATELLRLCINNPHGIKWWGDTKVYFPPPFVRDVEAILSGSA